MGLKRLQVPVSPLKITEMIHPLKSHNVGGWKRASQYGIQPCGQNGLQVYAQPASLRQIKSLRDALTSVINAWKKTPSAFWNNEITAYWEEHYLTTMAAQGTPGQISMCSLCGNRGVIDTRDRAIAPNGTRTCLGRLNYCICPNGQAMRLAKGDMEGALK